MKLIKLILLLILISPVEAGKKRRVTYTRPTANVSTISTPFIVYPSGDLKTKEEIVSWLDKNYRGRNINSLSSDVAPRSDVWIHLTRDHGWDRSQVNTLSMTQALYLHDAAHRSAYFPRKEKLEKFEKIIITPKVSQVIQSVCNSRIF